MNSTTPTPPGLLARVWAWVASWFSPSPTIEEELDYHDRLERLFERAIKAKSERDELLFACKVLLCNFYGHFGPLGEGDMARYACRLVEKADGRAFDPKAWILENAQRIRFDQ